MTSSNRITSLNAYIVKKARTPLKTIFKTNGTKGTEGSRPTTNPTTPVSISTSTTQANTLKAADRILSRPNESDMGYGCPFMRGAEAGFCRSRNAAR